MRLFVAIELPERIRVAVENVTSKARAKLPRARWVTSRNLHLTLAFLGEVPEERLRALGDALTRACAGGAPFTLQLEGSGCFPPRGKARVAWIGFRSSPEVVRLQGEISAALQAAVGYEPERRDFRPHLTVARCAPPWPSSTARIWSGAVNGSLGDEFRVESISLVRSRLTPAGASYASLHRFPLGAAA